MPGFLKSEIRNSVEFPVSIFEHWLKYLVTQVLVTVTPEGRDFSPAGLSPFTRPASRDCPSEDLILTLYYVTKY